MKVICFGDSHANFYKNIDICEGWYLMNNINKDGDAKEQYNYLLAIGLSRKHALNILSLKKQYKRIREEEINQTVEKEKRKKENDDNNFLFI